MNTKHGAHTIDDYLDDNDFNMLVDRIFNNMKETSWSKEDFPENYDNDYDTYSRTMDVIVDYVTDFVEEEACDDFGWKYGAQASVNRYVPTAEKIYEKIKTMW